jgi:hypothetical protein
MVLGIEARAPWMLSTLTTLSYTPNIPSIQKAHKAEVTLPYACTPRLLSVALHAILRISQFEVILAIVIMSFK